MLLVAVLLILNYFNLLPKKTYSAEDFGFDTILSSVDFNDNSIDDYTDILLGARADAENHPTYDGSYYVGGYPPDILEYAQMSFGEPLSMRVFSTGHGR